MLSFLKILVTIINYQNQTNLAGKKFPDFFQCSKHNHMEDHRIRSILLCSWSVLRCVIVCPRGWHENITLIKSMFLWSYTCMCEAPLASVLFACLGQYARYLAAGLCDLLGGVTVCPRGAWPGWLPPV